MAWNGILILMVGISLVVGMVGLIVGLHRRTGAAYALLTVGLLTGVPALVLQAALLRAVPGDLLAILSVQALALGLVSGFVQEGARLVGYQVLAPGAVARPHALMIGIGFGLPVTGYTSLLAFGLGWSLLGYGAEPPDDPAGLMRSAGAEALNGLLPLVMHMALSWIVLTALLRGQLFWLFGAIFAHGVIEMMATLLGPNDSWIVVIWRGVVALLSLIAILSIRPPASDQPGDQPEVAASG